MKYLIKHSICTLLLLFCSIGLFAQLTVNKTVDQTSMFVSTSFPEQVTFTITVENTSNCDVAYYLTDDMRDSFSVGDLYGPQIISASSTDGFYYINPDTNIPIITWSDTIPAGQISTLTITTFFDFPWNNNYYNPFEYTNTAKVEYFMDCCTPILNDNDPDNDIICQCSAILADNDPLNDTLCNNICQDLFLDTIPENDYLCIPTIGDGPYEVEAEATIFIEFCNDFCDAFFNHTFDECTGDFYAQSFQPTRWIPYEWFVDGNPVGVSLPDLNYTLSPGTHEICGMTYDECFLYNCEWCVTVTVLDYEAECNANFTYTIDPNTGAFAANSPSPDEWFVDGLQAGIGNTFTTILPPGIHDIVHFGTTICGLDCEYIETVTVIDSDPCTVPFETVIITTGDTLDCNNPTIGFEAYSNPPPNSPTDYTYEWSGPGILGANTASAGTTTPGTFQVTVTDPNGCTSVASIIIEEDFSVPNISIDAFTTVLTSTINSIDLEVIGTGNYTYNWWQQNNNTSTLTVTEPGTYTVYVGNLGNGCGTQASITITEDTGCIDIIPCNAQFTYSYTTEPNGAYNVTAIPVDGFAYGGYFVINSISQTTGQNNFILQPEATYDFCYFTAGDQDCETCETCETIVINTLPCSNPFVADIIASAPSATCNAPTILLDVITNPAPGTPNNYSYEWSGSASGSTGSTIPVIPTIPETFTVTVTDLLGCTATADIFIDTDFTIPNIFIDAPTTVLSNTITSIDLEVIGTGNYTYNWWQQNNNTSTLTVTEPGTYTVYVGNSDNGCGTQASITIEFCDDICNAEYTTFFNECTGVFEGGVIQSSSSVPYEWYVDGNLVGNEPGLVYTLSQGTHEICLMTYDECMTYNCEWCETLIVLDDNCNANFTYTLDSNTGIFSATSASPDEWFVDGLQAGIGNSFTTTLSPGLHSIIHVGTTLCGLDCEYEEGVTVIGNIDSCNYELGEVELSCDFTPNNTLCMPLFAKNNVPNGIIGMDFCMTYNSSLVIPTGNIELGSVVLDSNPNANYAINTSLPNMVCVTIYYTSDAPVGTDFVGSGEIACVEFEPLSTFFDGLNTGQPVNAGFGMDNLIESYELDIVQECADEGFAVINQNGTIMEANIRYWDDYALPLAYDSNNPLANLITNITGTDSDCNPLTNTSMVTPDLLGHFQYDINNGTSISLDRDINNGTQVMPTINGMDCYYAHLVTTLDPSFTPSPYQIIAMDVNMNGSVTAGDITHMQNRITLNIGEFPQLWNDNTADDSKDWLFVDDATLMQPNYTVSNSYPFDDGAGFYRLNVPQPEFCYEIPMISNGICTHPDSTNYHAILLGDTDKSWTTNTTSLRLGDDTQVVLDIDEAIIIEEECSLMFPIRIEDMETVKAIDFVMEYNTSKLAFDGYVYGDLINDAEMGMAYNQIENSDILFTSYSKAQQGIENDNTIYYYAKFSILSDEISIIPSDISFKQSFVDGLPSPNTVTGTEASCKMDNSDEVSFSIYPNPFNNRFSIELTGYPQDTEFTLFFYDVAGKLIDARKFVDTYYDYENQNLARGIYLYELKIGKELVEAGRLISQ